MKFLSIDSLLIPCHPRGNEGDRRIFIKEMIKEKNFFFLLHKEAFNVLYYLYNSSLYRCNKGENPGEFRFSPTGFPPYTPISATPSKRPLAWGVVVV